MTKFLIIHTCFCSCRKQGTFCRISDKGPVSVLHGNVGIAVDTIVFEKNFGFQRFRLDEFSACINFLNSHLVFGKCTGLIGANDIDASNRLTGDHLLHQCVFSGHFDNIQCQ